MTEKQLRTQRRFSLFVLYALAALWGIFRVRTADLVLTESTERLCNGSMLMLVLSAQFGFMWFCSVDARLMGKRPLHLAKIGIFFGWPIGVPIYAIWARGVVRGLLMVLIHAFLLFVTCLGAAILATLLYHGPGWSTGHA